jgi:hypothetical protein
LQMIILTSLRSRHKRNSKEAADDFCEATYRTSQYLNINRIKPTTCHSISY